MAYIVPFSWKVFFTVFILYYFNMSEQPQQPKEEEKKITEDEFYDELLIAIDESKPPSVWRERLFFIALGLLAGLGLGVFFIVFVAK